jgi:prephenate dehydratase
VLSEFSRRDVNLTRIESRPRRTGLGHYFFFVDIEGPEDAEPVRKALDAVRSHVGELRVLGSYGLPLWLH